MPLGLVDPLSPTSTVGPVPHHPPRSRSPNATPMPTPPHQPRLPSTLASRKPSAANLRSVSNTQTSPLVSSKLSAQPLVPPPAKSPKVSRTAQGGPDATRARKVSGTSTSSPYQPRSRAQSLVSQSGESVQLRPSSPTKKAPALPHPESPLNPSPVKPKPRLAGVVNANGSPRPPAKTPGSRNTSNVFPPLENSNNNSNYTPSPPPPKLPAVVWPVDEEEESVNGDWAPSLRPPVSGGTSEAYDFSGIPLGSEGVPQYRAEDEMTMELITEIDDGANSTKTAQTSSASQLHALQAELRMLRAKLEEERRKKRELEMSANKDREALKVAQMKSALQQPQPASMNASVDLSTLLRGDGQGGFNETEIRKVVRAMRASDRLRLIHIILDSCLPGDISAMIRMLEKYAASTFDIVGQQEMAHASPSPRHMETLGAAVPFPAPPRTQLGHGSSPVYPRELRRDDPSVGYSFWEEKKCLKAKAISCLDYLPDEEVLVAGFHDVGRVQLFSTVTWQPIQTLQGHLYGIRAVALSPKYLVSAGADKALVCWDWRAGQKTDDGVFITKIVRFGQQTNLNIGVQIVDEDEEDRGTFSIPRREMLSQFKLSELGGSDPVLSAKLSTVGVGSANMLHQGQTNDMRDQKYHSHLEHEDPSRPPRSHRPSKRCRRPRPHPNPSRSRRPPLHTPAHDTVSPSLPARITQHAPAQPEIDGCAAVARHDHAPGVVDVCAQPAGHGAWRPTGDIDGPSWDLNGRRVPESSGEEAGQAAGLVERGGYAGCGVGAVDPKKRRVATSTRFSSRLGADRRIFVSTYNLTMSHTANGKPNRKNCPNLNRIATLGGAWAALAEESEYGWPAQFNVPAGFKGLATPEKNPMAMALSHEEVVVGTADGTIYVMSFVGYQYKASKENLLEGLTLEEIEEDQDQEEGEE
ncbi:WD40 domain-containing protein [Rhizoctonia solani]|uniref:WD40 domain-containing protein n=1 Tax=Rhizoctonia solani TaxID=456999 RepID=A0A8H8NU70_9AGAM|nr:WD40 domain-containing protein [Rhizoctonia solani]QRW18832.1 WD40 domain-containing protein [Rhizoctonia solani]